MGGRWVGPVMAVTVVLLAACAGDDGAGPASVAAPTSTEVPTAPDPAPPAAPDPDPPAAPGRPSVAVTEVIDGDTIEVRLRSGTVERVRLVGINAPEDGECLSADAAGRLAELIGRGPVRLERDVSDRDQYGRLLRHVFAGGRSVGEALVAEGLALSRAYPPDTTRQPALDAAQTRAQAAGAGQWAPDACGPATGASVAIGATRTNPPGDESLTPNEEWIEVVNTGGRPVDLTGWGVRDESASHRFSFPSGFRLGAGATVRIHTGCGAATAGALHWCISGSAVWNNDGDTAFLTDPRGNVVDQRAV